MNATRRSADTLKSKKLILYAVIFIPLICLSGSALTADETPTGSDDTTAVQTRGCPNGSPDGRPDSC